MTKDYGHEVRFSPEHHILLKYGKNLLKYPESVKKIGNGKLNLLGTLFMMENITEKILNLEKQNKCL